jgi:2-oxoglutarate ferredoxin oxidoreductase subunit delta
MKKIYFGNLQPKKGKIHIAKDMCKGCGFCVEYCPEDVLELSAEFNVKGYHPPHVKHEDKCLYCQLCETICPEFAIFVTQKTPGEEEPSLSEAETSGTAGEAHKEGGNR